MYIFIDIYACSQKKGFTGNLFMANPSENPFNFAKGFL